MHVPTTTKSLAALGLGIALAVGMGGCEGADPANALIGSKKTAEHLKVKMQMKGLGDAILAMELSSGNWPTSLQELASDGSIKPSDTEDPWGNDFVYAPPETTGDKPVLYSFGPDGKSGTGDDIDHQWQ